MVLVYEGKMIESILKVKPRTRIAPSPTGFAHVGTAYTALFNWAFAKKHNGDFILRLEDTDIKRHVAGAEEAIYAGLAWLGLDWSEGPDKGGPYGPYRQSERLNLYQKYANKLLQKKMAYKEKGAVIFKTRQEEVSWKDLVRGTITFPPDQLTDFVIIKSNGYPTYNFAVVVDDIEMKITHVIRGEEHISNTPRQISIYKALGCNWPAFAHLPTLRNTEHKKLSKRKDPVDLRLYRQDGYLPEALVNFLCLLGWSHPEGKEVFSLSEFVNKFDITRVRKAGPVFDIGKLDWLNGVYIRQKDNAELAKILMNYISASIEEDKVVQIAGLIKTRIRRLSEVEGLISFFWERPSLGKAIFGKKESLMHISVALEALRQVKEWKLEQINQALEKVIQDYRFITGDFYMSIRIALTGKKITPPINESMVILGQDETIMRLESAEKVLLGQG